MSRSAARWKKTSTASATACARPSPPGARRWSIASISSTATRPTRNTRCNARSPRYEAGARWVVLCDTNGGTLPHEVERIVREVAEAIPGERLGIHAHNDTDNAVANSLAAVRAGVRQVQGTLNGLGERCGNANLVSLIPTLALKQDFAERFEIGVSAQGAGRPRAAARTFRRVAEPRARPARALCRRLGVRHQGGHPRLRAGEGPAHLRARAARERRQRARDPGLRSGRALQSGRAVAAARARRQRRRPAPGARARRGEGARGAGLRL